MTNPSKRKGDNFERAVIRLAEYIGIKAYRNRMSRAIPGESWDVMVSGRKCECKKRASGFKQIRKWLEGNDAVIIGSDYEPPLVVIKLEDWIKLL